MKPRTDFPCACGNSRRQFFSSILTPLVAPSSFDIYHQRFRTVHCGFAPTTLCCIYLRDCCLVHSSSISYVMNSINLLTQSSIRLSLSSIISYHILEATLKTILLYWFSLGLSTSHARQSDTDLLPPVVKTNQSKQRLLREVKNEHFTAVIGSNAFSLMMFLYC